MRPVKLLNYTKRLSADERERLATSCGTTVGHLNNVSYGIRKASAALAKQLARNTSGQVPEWESRPDDWHEIWPELIGAEGAPAIPTEAQRDAA